MMTRSRKRAGALGLAAIFTTSAPKCVSADRRQSARLGGDEAHKDGARKAEGQRTEREVLWTLFRSYCCS